MLETLPSDREYSQKLKDFLIDEYHRLNQLKKEILKQVIRVPEEKREFIETLLSGGDMTPQEEVAAIEVTPLLNKQETIAKFPLDEEKPVANLEPKLPEKEDTVSEPQFTKKPELKKNSIKEERNTKLSSFKFKLE